MGRGEEGGREGWRKRKTEENRWGGKRRERERRGGRREREGEREVEGQRCGNVGEIEMKIETYASERATRREREKKKQKTIGSKEKNTWVHSPGGVRIPERERERERER